MAVFGGKTGLFVRVTHNLFSLRPPIMEHMNRDTGETDRRCEVIDTGGRGPGKEQINSSNSTLLNDKNIKKKTQNPVISIKRDFRLHNINAMPRQCQGGRPPNPQKSRSVGVVAVSDGEKWEIHRMGYYASVMSAAIARPA